MSDRLAEIRARHQQIEMVSEWGADSERYPACKRCRDPWPCDTVALLAEVERLHRLETAVRHYHEGHGYIERSQRWQAVRALLEVQQKGGEG